jgi:isopropylmalate/homocitrate/citramalate synthase
MGKKINPRKIPKTQADVDRAYERGKADGAKSSIIIMMYAMKDKFGASDEELSEFFSAITYTVDSINKGYITEKDLQTVIKEEYDLEFVMKG